MKVIKGTDIEVPIDSVESLKKTAEHYFSKEGKIYGGNKEAYIRGFMACNLYWITVHPVVEKETGEEDGDFIPCIENCIDLQYER